MSFKNRGFRHGWMATFGRANLPVEFSIPLKYPNVDPAPSDDPAAPEEDDDSDGTS